MSSVEKMYAFIIRVLFVLMCGALIYCTLKYALPLFMPFVLAFAIAFILKPLINKIWDKTKISRKLIAVVILSFLYLVLAALLVFLGARLVVSLAALFRSLPNYYQTTIEPAMTSLSDWFNGILVQFDPASLAFFDSVGDNISTNVSNLISTVSAGAINMLTGVASKVPLFIISFGIMIISSYFFVVDYYTVTNFLKRQFSDKTQHRLIVIRDFVVNVLFKFTKAYLILLGITFVEVTVGLLILRVPYAILIALLVACLDILPILGTGTVLLPWAAYNLVTGNYFQGIGMLILYVAITVVRQILEPRVVGKQIGLYPLLTLVCMFLGARFFGFWGLLGFPVALTVVVYLNKTGEIKLFKE